MADTNLHRKVWFRALPWQLRESWRILCAECDMVGVWEIDLQSLNLWLGTCGDTRVTLEQLTEAFDLKQIDDDKAWIPGFVPFQYGDEAGAVSWKNKLRAKIVRMLEARQLPLPQFKDIPRTHNDDPPSRSAGSPTHGVKEEDKDKEEDEVEDQEEDKESGFEIRTLADLKRKIPLYYQQKWPLMYPAPGWLDQEIERCFDYHKVDPVTRPRTSGQWMKKLLSWLAKGWSDRQAGMGSSSALAADIDAKIKAKFKDKGIQ